MGLLGAKVKLGSSEQSSLIRKHELAHEYYGASSVEIFIANLLPSTWTDVNRQLEDFGVSFETCFQFDSEYFYEVGWE